MTRRHLWVAALCMFILAPRLAIFGNGLDAQRIWDTNVPAALHLFESVHGGSLQAFFSAPQKYPFMGSLAYVPVIGAYYGAGRVMGAFASSADFANAFVLGETALYAWIRAFMLAVNLFSLWLLYRLTARFSASLGQRAAATAGTITVLLAAANIYVTLFSVTPRIHSWAFFGNIVALYGSLLLLERKTWKTLCAGFGGAALAASLSQSGFPALILPILASFYDGEKRRWAGAAGVKFCVAGLVLFAVATLAVGYPQILAAIFGRLPLGEVFLSAEHSAPGVSIRHLGQFAIRYIFSTDMLLAWLAVAGMWFAWCCRKRDRIRGDAMDMLAIAHIVFFVLLFGFTNVLAGRFTLAVLPSAFFLLARFVVRAQKKRGVIAVALVLFAFQGASVMFLARAGAGGDTRAQAAAYLLSHTTGADHLLATIDPQLLGIVPAPSSIEGGHVGFVGAMERAILSRDLVGAKTRQIALWDPAVQIDLSYYRFIVVSADHPDRYRAEDALNAAGWREAAHFAAVGDPRSKASIPWDVMSPAPKTPLAFHLWKFRAFGPTIEIYEK